MNKNFHKKRKLIIVVALSVVFLCTSVVVVATQSGSSNSEKNKYSLHLVETVEPILFKGIVNSKSIDEYYLDESNGKLENIHVENGQLVHRGEVLLTYNDEKMTQQAQTQSFTVKQSEADLNNSVLDLSLAQEKREQVNQEILVLEAEMNGAVEELEINELNSQMELLNEQTAAADDAIIQAERAIATAQLQLDEARNGVEQAQNQAIKQIVSQQEGIAIVDKDNQTNADRPIVKIINQEVFVEGQVSEFDYKKIEIGQIVDLRTTALGQETTGEIYEISPIPVTENSGSSNQSSKVYSFLIKPNMALQYGFSIQIGLSQSDIFIPKKTVVSKKNQEFVYVYEDGKAIEREVTIEEAGTKHQVLEGLSSGEKIIKNPDQTLENNQKVELDHD